MNEAAAALTRQLRILWAGLLASQIIYAVMATVISQQNKPKAVMQPMLIALASTSLVELAIGFFLRDKLMPARKRSEASHPDVTSAVRRVRAASIVGWAFCEAVAINGLILSMLTYQPIYAYAFTAVGVLAMITQAPSARLVQAVFDANQP